MTLEHSEKIVIRDEDGNIERIQEHKWTESMSYYAQHEAAMQDEIKAASDKREAKRRGRDALVIERNSAVAERNSLRSKVAEFLALVVSYEKRLGLADPLHRAAAAPPLTTTTTTIPRVEEDRDARIRIQDL